MLQAWTKGEVYGIQIMEKQWRFQLKESWVTGRGPSLFRSQNTDCIANEHREKTFTIKKAVWFSSSSLILGCICLHPCTVGSNACQPIKSKPGSQLKSTESGPNKNHASKALTDPWVVVPEQLLGKICVCIYTHTHTYIYIYIYIYIHIHHVLPMGSILYRMVLSRCTIL